jgi:hypothetical protein
LAEVTLFRFKKLFGRSLHARTLPTQKNEVACKVVNIMTGLGMPVSRWSAPGKGELRPLPVYCTRVMGVSSDQLEQSDAIAARDGVMTDLVRKWSTEGDHPGCLR